MCGQYHGNTICPWSKKFDLPPNLNLKSYSEFFSIIILEFVAYIVLLCNDHINTTLFDIFVPAIHIHCIYSNYSEWTSFRQKVLTILCYVMILGNSSKKNILRLRSAFCDFFLDEIASLGSMLESQWFMFLRFCQILGISSGCVQDMFRVCSEYVQSMFRVCSKYVQSMFRVCSEYVKSMFRVFSEYA